MTTHPAAHVSGGSAVRTPTDRFSAVPAATRTGEDLPAWLRPELPTQVSRVWSLGDLA